MWFSGEYTGYASGPVAAWWASQGRPLVDKQEIRDDYFRDLQSRVEAFILSALESFVYV